MKKILILLLALVSLNINAQVVGLITEDLFKNYINVRSICVDGEKNLKGPFIFGFDYKDLGGGKNYLDITFVGKGVDKITSYHDVMVYYVKIKSKEFYIGVDKDENKLFKILNKKRNPTIEIYDREIIEY